jgi:hypothetical protein
MDDWTISEVKAIVKALRYCLEVQPPGAAWGVKAISTELRYWLGKLAELERSGRPAPAHSQARQAGSVAGADMPGPGRAEMTTRPAGGDHG